jgi:glycosyltransferase involved in cell wall biosynthesis
VVRPKILFVADYAPPYNKIGALRVGKTIKYLAKLGYEVRLLTAHHEREYDLSLPLVLPNHLVHYADSPRIYDLEGEKYASLSTFKKVFRRLIFSLKYKNPYFLLREDSLSWIPIATKVGQQLINEWRPDFIMSSALPISAHVIAGRLSRKGKIPWIAEYRDLWLRTETLTTTGMLDLLHRASERFIIRNAKLLVTVSDSLAEYLRTMHTTEVITSYTGFDEVSIKQKSTTRVGLNKILTLAYTGSVYLSGRSICDPRPLFKAIRLLGDSRKQLVIQIYTDKNLELEKIIKDLEVDDVVKLCGRVAYRQSIDVQQSADVLLFFGYSAQVGSKQGIVSGKAVEYLGALRPIISIGEDADHPFCQERLMKNYKEPEAIAKYLTQLISQKNSLGYVPAPYTVEQIKKWSAEYQVSLLSQAISKIRPGAKASSHTPTH